MPPINDLNQPLVPARKRKPGRGRSLKPLKPGGRRTSDKDRARINRDVLRGPNGVATFDTRRWMDCRRCLGGGLVCRTAKDAAVACECDEKGETCDWQKCRACKGKGAFVLGGEFVKQPA